MKKRAKIAVLGGGLWGTVLAQHVSRPGRRVRLWEFFAKAAEGLRSSRRHPHIPGFRLDPRVEVTSDLALAVKGADVLLFVLPSSHLRATAARVREALGSARPSVVNASKGIEPGTLLTMGEVLSAELPRLASRVRTLSGPSFAREVARGVPTRMVLAGPGGPEAEALRRLLEGGALRVELSSDRKGVELGGSLKNVLAIGAGILDGLASSKAAPAGANTKAALFIQGLAEMGGLVRAAGGRAETVYGLAGLGDLIATGTSPESRNRAFGEKLGRGVKPRAAAAQIATVVEGVEASASARALARRTRAACPLVETISGIVRGGRPPRTLIRALGF